MKFEAADRWLKSRLQMPTALNTRGLAELESGIRAHAFFSARVAEARVLDAIREVSDRYSRGELDLATARATIKERLGTRRAPGSKEDSRLTDICSTARLDLILGQNARMAYAVGEYEQGMDTMARRLFPAWRYVRSTAASPRAKHAAYAGRVWMKDDPVWRSIFPPSDFGCRCSVEEVSADEIDGGSARVEGRTADKDVPPHAKSGFYFNPEEPFNCNMGALSDAEARRTVMEKIRREVDRTTRPLRFRCLAAPPGGGLARPAAGEVTASAEALQKFVEQAAEAAANQDGRQLPKVPKLLDIGTLSEDTLSSLGLNGSTRVVLQSKNSSQGVKHMAKNHPDATASGEFAETLTRLLTRKGMEASLSVERGQPYILHVREPGTANLLTMRRLPNGDWSVVSAHDVADRKKPTEANNYLNNKITTTITNV